MTMKGLSTQGNAKDDLYGEFGNSEMEGYAHKRVGDMNLAMED